MQYFISFLEGIITFISPCLLPMLPVYISYFAGGQTEKNSKRTFICSIGFVLGFTLVFVAMGAMAGSLGAFLSHNQKIVNIVCGLMVIFFGLSFMGVINLNIFSKGISVQHTFNKGFLSSFVFGLIFSVGWTPCVGVFLGSALALASQQGKVLQGMAMLFAYSMGLGIPFILSALIIDKLKNAFDWIKRNYKTINTVCGIVLIVVGIAMATGSMNSLISILS